MKQNRNESIQIVAAQIGMDPTDLAAIWDGYSFDVGLDSTLVKRIEKEGQWVRSSGIVAPDAPEPNYNSLVTDSVLMKTK